MSDDNFISRWSRRKLASKAGPDKPTADAIPAKAGIQPPMPVSEAPVPEEAPPLPPVESLTPESDFTPFMGDKVDPALRRAALKTLFSDPRYNVMDGLDVYIDDYSKPDPLPDGWLEKLNQVARLGDYRPPAPQEELSGAAAVGQKNEVEQPLVEAPAEPPADTSAPVSPASESKES